MNILIELFLMFFKIGLFTFGGGYAMISIIEDNCVVRKGWITHDEMMEMTVIAESTPGPIAINCATYTGYKKAGFFGALISTVAMVLPSFIIILIVSSVLDRFLEITVVANAFAGIKIAVGILILDAAITMIRKMKKKKMQVAVMLTSFAVMLAVNIFALGISSVVLMIACGAFGLLCFFIKDKGGAAK